MVLRFFKKLWKTLKGENFRLSRWECLLDISFVFVYIGVLYLGVKHEDPLLVGVSIAGLAIAATDFKKVNDLWLI